MSDRDKMIGELRIKLSNIEYAGHERGKNATD